MLTRLRLKNSSYFAKWKPNNSGWEFEKPVNFRINKIPNDINSTLKTNTKKLPDVSET